MCFFQLIFQYEFYQLFIALLNSNQNVLGLSQPWLLWVQFCFSFSRSDSAPIVFKDKTSSNVRKLTAFIPTEAGGKQNWVRIARFFCFLKPNNHDSFGSFSQMVCPSNPIVNLFQPEFYSMQVTQLHIVSLRSQQRVM